MELLASLTGCELVYDNIAKIAGVDVKTINVEDIGNIYYVELKIPNYEIKLIFQKEIIEKYAPVLDYSEVRTLNIAITNNDIEQIKIFLNKYLLIQQVILIIPTNHFIMD